MSMRRFVLTLALAAFTLPSVSFAQHEHRATVLLRNGERVSGTLEDVENGTVFDSTEGKGPAPLLVGQVIPGFAEGLTRMQQGGRYKLHIPSDLAYGANPPSGGPIPPNADLEFDIHVVQVAPNAAAMMQGGAPQQ